MPVVNPLPGDSIRGLPRRTCWNGVLRVMRASLYVQAVQSPRLRLAALLAARARGKAERTVNLLADGVRELLATAE